MSKSLMQTKSKQGLQYKVTAVYGKPLFNEKQVVLLDPGPLQDLKLQQALKTLSRSILMRIRVGIMQTAYSAAARMMLAKSVSVIVRNNSIQVTAKHPAFRALIMGQRKQQMTWLMTAKAPIPIVTETGQVIFRSATPRSMADGRWIHPGRKSMGIVEKARAEAREAVKKRLVAEIRAVLRKAVPS